MMLNKGAATAKAANWQHQAPRGFSLGLVGRLRICQFCDWRSYLYAGFKRCPNCDREFIQ